MKVENLTSSELEEKARYFYEKLKSGTSIWKISRENKTSPSTVKKIIEAVYLPEESEKLLKKDTSAESDNENEGVIVLDVSALNHPDSKMYIDKAKKVIITYTTFREMDDCKNKSAMLPQTPVEVNLKRRIQALFYQSALDRESGKYVMCFNHVAVGESKDEAIVKVAQKKFPGASVLTADFGMCNAAKFWNVPYILLDYKKPLEKIEEKLQASVETLPEEKKVEIVPEKIEKKENSVPALQLIKYGKDRVFIAPPNSKFFICNMQGEMKNQMYAGRYRIEAFDWIVNVSDDKNAIFYHATTNKNKKIVMKAVEINKVPICVSGMVK